ncbi:maleylpyruvate isomerase N-terminal domain-containing protein [Labrys wisconsinensis]|uniref:Maleylpyruvate isomerase n=1 Tax=Labrys wisconsinensis TaxID=425677 RepID=A0ABU0JCS7_9HYPH|nr:maleylpyruvate isomerase N-terminal domain-containing protein [Labrys wisconsinensis]MDQ0472084.1 maleylpyruvate isomerase [Labrys wisconsinensis]
MTGTLRPREEEQALVALRERQGKGARYDSPAAPARELLWARRGAAYFARRLGELDDEGLDGPSLVPGCGRRLLVSHVGYQARALARIAEAAHEGREKEGLGDPDQPPDDVALGATLPAHALRYLFEHAQAHLSVAWRDLSDAAWDRPVESLSGRSVTPRGTVRERAASIWIHAVDLGNGGSIHDLPPELLAAVEAEGRPRPPFALPAARLG